MIDQILNKYITWFIDYAISVGMSHGELIEYSTAEINARYKK